MAKFLKPMNLNNKLLIVLIFVFSVAVVLLAIQNHNISQIVKREKIPETGDKAYIFTTNDLTGQKVSNKATPSLLIFYNTTCESCDESAKLWQKFYQEISTSELRIIGISADPVAQIQNFIAKHELTFPIIADLEGNILVKYRVKYFPLIVFVNQKGEILLYQSDGQYVQDALNKAEEILTETS